jgi:hypothetical protein
MGKAIGEAFVKGLVFNYHCLPYDSIGPINNAVIEFLKICLKTYQFGFTVILIDENIDANWFRVELAPGYFWQDWYNQANKDSKLVDQIRAFRAIATKKPFFPIELIGSDLELFDVREPISGKRLSALRAASWFDSPLVSFPTRCPWNQSPIEIIKETIENGKIQEQSGMLINLYSIAYLASIEQKLLQMRNDLIHSGRALWEQRSVFYPNLEFCGKAPIQLKTWSALPKVLSQVQRSLDILQTFAELWKEGKVKQYSHQCLKDCGLPSEVTGESLTVYNHPDKRECRMFYLPSGNKEYFENHIKLSHGYRIHFFPNPNDKKVYIGHVGPHLPV